MKKKNTGRRYLERSADILCKAAYELCRDSYRHKDAYTVADAKGLKEICSAVKETICISDSLNKNDGTASERLSIIMDSAAAEFAE